MSTLNAKRILVVDDEQDILLLLQRRLESSGYEVITACTGQDGLEKARTEAPDLIILDLMLPGLDGYQICGILKHDRRYMKMPILVLTARAQLKDYELGMKVGADAYVTKPFEPQSLLIKIEELLSKNKKQSSSKEEQRKLETSGGTQSTQETQGTPPPANQKAEQPIDSGQSTVDSQSNTDKSQPKRPSTIR
jgi:DNA-binding response OmpR family regulator